MLTEVLELLRKHRRLSLRELADYFKMEPAALEPILDILLRKERIRTVSAECCSTGGSCKGCSCSSRESMLVYEAVDNESRRLSGQCALSRISSQLR
ncbi:MAG: hypothetical protein GQ565_06800 [Candidatus Aegiribacteria sp.]|nr:hypothetical protein [Candidatus Aegiribacteria sp.]